MGATGAETLELTPSQAVNELLRVERRTDSLLSRTVGLTWMLWALINGGIFLSYEAIALAGPSGVPAGLAYGLAWAPWVALGALATGVLWRSLAIAAPTRAAGSPWATVMATATFLLLVLGGLAIVVFGKIPVDGVAWALFAVGIAAAVVGGSGMTTLTRSERILWLAGGVGLAVLAVGVELVAGRFGFDATGLLSVLAPIASTGLLFGGGLYTAAR